MQYFNKVTVSRRYSIHNACPRRRVLLFEFINIYVVGLEDHERTATKAEG
jgi:hypothetical protein